MFLPVHWVCYCTWCEWLSLSLHVPTSLSLAVCVSVWGWPCSSFFVPPCPYLCVHVRLFCPFFVHSYLKIFVCFVQIFVYLCMPLCGCVCVCVYMYLCVCMPACVCVCVCLVRRSFTSLWSCPGQLEHSFYFAVLHGVCAEDHCLWSAGECVTWTVCVSQTSVCILKICIIVTSICIYNFF